MLITTYPRYVALYLFCEYTRHWYCVDMGFLNLGSAGYLKYLSRYLLSMYKCPGSAWLTKPYLEVVEEEEEAEARTTIKNLVPSAPQSVHSRALFRRRYIQQAREVDLKKI